MNAIIISIGNELTSGQSLDTNSAHLSRRLEQRGISVLAHETVADQQAAIVEALLQASRRAELVIVTGGLGPTADDLTRHALAAAMGSELVLHEPSLAAIEEMFRRRGREMQIANRVQAMAPAGAEVLANPVGTAPGLAATIGASRVFVMPGVPHEMMQMFDGQVVPRLGEPEAAIVHRIVHTFGAGESDVGAAIADLMDRSANPTVGTTASGGIVSVRVAALGADVSQATAMAKQTVAEVRRRLGPVVFGEEEQTLATVVGATLRRRGQTLATAESCTGGLVSKLLTDEPGASDFYLGGVVSYANAGKQAMLDVPLELLVAHGAVSEPVAAAMAEGCRRRLGNDWAISITGIAGPGGGSELKPVGLVYIGLAGPSGTSVERQIFPGPRRAIRLRAAMAAMNLLRLAIS